MAGEAAEDRRVVRIGGADRIGFLQGLVTNDMRKLKQGPIYAAILTPQGKYLADFLLVPGLDPDTVLLDVAEPLARGVMQRLAMYRLRADVTIEPSDLRVQRGLGPPPPGAVADPRHPSLGWRLYTTDPGTPPAIDWDAIRVEACIPETGIELVPNESFILECGFERLGGVDHRKGCYVGQEVTARMKHKTELRKGLVRVAVEGAAEPGTPITAGERPAGHLCTRAGNRAIAYLRFDRAAGGGLVAGDARVEVLE